MRDSSSRIRPAGRSPGTLAPIAAWLVGVSIARLTGAAAVVLLLVATLVGLLGIALAGWWRLRSVRLLGMVTPTVATVDEPISIVLDHTDRSSSRAPVFVEIDGTMTLLEAASPTTLTFTPDQSGVVRSLDVKVLSAGGPAWIWWQRRHALAIGPIHVAPRASGPLLAITSVTSPTLGEASPGDGAKTGDVDGSRPWRPGESEQAIHWASTLRSGEVIAHDRTTEAETRWRVDLAHDAARLRFTIEEGLRYGHCVTLAPDSDARDDVIVTSVDDARRWSAIAAERSGAVNKDRQDAVSFWRRRVSFGPRSEFTRTVNARSRLATAACALISLWMLLGALDAGTATRGAALTGLAVATAISIRFTTAERPRWVSALVVGVAVAALARIAVQNADAGGLLEALRGPMPDLLMLLVVLHGAEIADRRTNRVHLAVTGVVTAYAAGLRIDGAVGWWMIAWAIAAIVAVCTTEHVDGGPTSPSQRGAARISAWTVAGVVATFAVASLVPIPDGPASLGLPALSDGNDVVDSPGALVGPDGSPTAPTSGSPTRGALGQVGGYPGFSTSLDTSVRGDLGDEVVMRVRAPEPAFWRGQTFADFDGRVWTVSEDAGGRTIEGPRIPVSPTIGDRVSVGTPTEEFVQTFHVEADLPNVVFAASRADTVIFDGSVTTRSDGALRADRTLSEGTVYSVVSRRVQVTAEMLRSQGDLRDRFAPFADRAAVAPFLALPASTSDETIQLAEQLRVEGSTYSTILAYQDWIARNTEYDLNAPVPAGDAVDDFLFNSRRGFCEQIASSLVVMLRSQGVPARLATGYIPGERDRISGVFAVKASDAHAWVEVWFPDTGWEAFDPTAAVPFAGEAERSTVGADATGAVLDAVLARPVEAGALVGAGFLLLAGSRALAEIRRRRARGPWGVLHDRFMALVPDAVTAPEAARRLTEEFGADAESAHDVARLLDRVAFDTDYQPTGADRAEAARVIRGQTPVSGRRVAPTEARTSPTG
jgi:transglutaminase-like putative cysteine protease